MEKLTSASFKQKEIDNIPKGAKILAKDTRISVEEIENGFLICKTMEVKYEYDRRTDYSYITKKYFSKENPLEIDLDNISLADKID